MKTAKQIILTIAGLFAFTAIRDDNGSMLIAAIVIASLCWFVWDWIEG